jgi:hypothetical protein
MQVFQEHFKGDIDEGKLDALAAKQPNVVMAFGNVRFFADRNLGKRLKSKFPDSLIMGCSTAGEIVANAAYENTLVVTAIVAPESAWFMTASTYTDAALSRQAGTTIAKEICQHKPQAVFVLAPGLNINGSELVKGLEDVLGTDISLSGGLAGDGLNFKETFTLAGDVVATNQIVALGIRDAKLAVSYGTQGGWQPFGLFRRVTRSSSNILYELDGKPALTLYKEYLGDKAKELPGSALLYPLHVVVNSQDSGGMIRTILSIDEAAGSLTLAGDVTEGHQVRLMHAKPRGLIDGAERAGQDACATATDNAHALGILISCVGRKIVMGDDVDEEVSVVHESFGDNAILTGFYSYGEICATNQQDKRPVLHNQTMTITRLCTADKAV